MPSSGRTSVSGAATSSASGCSQASLLNAHRSRCGGFGPDRPREPRRKGSGVKVRAGIAGTVVSTLTGDAGLKSTGEDQQGVDTNTTPPGATVWRVKYDGPCARCGTLLRKGTPAVWDRPTKTMHCVACPAEELAAAELPLAELEAMAPSPPAPTEPNTVALDPGIAGGSARHEYERRRDKRQDEVKG